MIESLIHGKLHNVGSNEKIRAKAHSLDDVQFLLYATISIFIARSIAINHPFKSSLAQQFQIVIDIVRKTAFVFHAIVQIDFTLIQDTFSILNELRIKYKSSFQPFDR